MQEVAAAAETMDHHPDIDIRWRTVAFALSTHSEGGLTQLDVELAHQISQEAAPAAGRRPPSRRDVERRGDRPGPPPYLELPDAIPLTLRLARRVPGGP